jgi:chromosome segregation ATPase
MNRRSVISELAKTLQISETEAEQILKAFAQVLGPIAAEVPPYFERYFETQIQLVLQRMEDFQHITQQQISNLQQQIVELRDSTQQQIAELRDSTQQQITNLRHYIDQRINTVEQRIDALERRLDRFEKWLFSVLVMILSGVLAIIFKIYFGG